MTECQMLSTGTEQNQVIEANLGVVHTILSLNQRSNSSENADVVLLYLVVLVVVLPNFHL